MGIQRRAALLNIRLTSHWPDDAIQIRSRERITFGEWHHITLLSDGSGKAAGLKLYVDGKLWETAVLQDSLRGSIATSAALRILNLDETITQQ